MTERGGLPLLSVAALLLFAVLWGLSMLRHVDRLGSLFVLGVILMSGGLTVVVIPARRTRHATLPALARDAGLKVMPDLWRSAGFNRY